jgi:hypothetical protein
VDDLGVIVAALAVLVVIAVLLVAAILGFRQLRRLLRGEY